mgnify:CR=1 FL=1
MKSKDKIKKHAKVSLKGIVVFLASIIIVLNIIVAYAYFFQKDEVYAKETNTNVQNVKISNASALNVEEIMNKNAEEAQQDEYYVEETELEYITKYQQNEQLPTGVMQVIQEGRNGKQEITTKRSYKNGEVVLEEQISSKITKASINKIVEVGSGKGRSTYKVKVGDTVYVTSDRASVMTEPSEEAQKIATLTKGMDVKIVVIENGWYKISGQGVDGYIKGENTTYINPNAKYEGNINNNLENKNNIQSLRFDMALNKPSGLSLEQFKKVLTDSKDKNNIFKNNAQYFYYIEQQYNINGLFVAAVGIHESNWGTSKIAQNKHNLFGYGAYDSNPYNGAYQFTNYSESIDLIARVFVKYYLNPKGTSIYGGEKAAGTYYNGHTLSGINKKYATDKNWANGVYKHMQYLYNKL